MVGQLLTSQAECRTPVLPADGIADAEVDDARLSQLIGPRKGLGKGIDDAVVLEHTGPAQHQIGFGRHALLIQSGVAAPCDTRRMRSMGIVHIVSGQRIQLHRLDVIFANAVGSTFFGTIEDSTAVACSSGFRVSEVDMIVLDAGIHHSNDDAFARIAASDAASRSLRLIVQLTDTAFASGIEAGDLVPATGIQTLDRRMKRQLLQASQRNTKRHHPPNLRANPDAKRLEILTRKDGIGSQDGQHGNQGGFLRFPTDALRFGAHRTAQLEQLQVHPALGRKAENQAKMQNQ